MARATATMGGESENSDCTSTDLDLLSDLANFQFSYPFIRRILNTQIAGCATLRDQGEYTKRLENPR